MDAQIVKVWSAWETVNEYDKHGRCIGIFNEKEAAESAAKGRGWYGGNGAVAEENTILVNGKAFILKQKEPVELNLEVQKLWEARKSALAKLTDTDKIALGIKLDA